MLIRKVSLFLVLGMIVVTLLGCYGEGNAIDYIKINEDSSQEDVIVDEFDLNNLQIEIVYEDGEKEFTPVDETMISDADLNKLEEAGTHTMTIQYEGHSATFTITLLEDALSVKLKSIYDAGTAEGVIGESYEEWLEDIKGDEGVGIEDVHMSGDDIVIELSDGSQNVIGFPNVYTVIFIDPEGMIFDLDTVFKGEDAKAAEELIIPDHVDSAHYEDDLTAIDSNRVVQVEFTHKTHEVTFYDEDGEVLSTVNVEHGGTATAPEAPVVEGKNFDGWDSDLDAIEEPKDIYPKYSEKPMELMWFSDGDEDEAIQELLNQYEEEKGVTIELVEIAYDDYGSRLRTRLRDDEAPALARTTEGHLNNFSEHVIELNETFDAADFANVFSNAAGNPLGLPMDVHVNGMFVNLDLLDTANVDYPALGEEVWTWSEFETEMDKLRGEDGVTAPGIFDPQAHRTFPLLYQHGVTVWDEPYTSSNLTDQAAIDAFTMLQDFYENGLLSDTVYAGSNAASEFRTGGYGFHMSGNWNVSNYQTLDFHWTVVPMPKESNRATILGGKHMAAFQGSGMEDEALDFIEWLAEPAQHDYYNEQVSFLSARRDADIDFGDIHDEYQVLQDEISATDTKYTDDWLNQIMIEGMYPEINQTIENIAQGNDVASELGALETWLKENAPE